MRYRYFDPFEQSVVEGDLTAGAELPALVGRVTALRPQYAPALELAGEDGASVVLGVDRDRAVVLWTPIDGTTRHTVGAPGECAVFDYFGACAQMPGHYAVPLATAVGAARDFVDGYPSRCRAPSLPLAFD